MNNVQLKNRQCSILSYTARMGRRSDHSREELRDLFLKAGQAHLADVGFARFSGREVAKQVGYSIGTLYNIFGSLDGLLVAINSRTFDLWSDHLRDALEAGGEDRIRALVEGYFSFAETHPNLWMAIYDHRLPEGVTLDADAEARRTALVDIVEAEIERELGDKAQGIEVERLTRSLVATVHGHCNFMLTGSFALMGEERPVELALARVRDSMAAAAR